MRAALDDVGAEPGRYVRLTNYASGLCMPEIAVLAGLERLDMMLNDAMYGILFRDINPQRTVVDQRFSRMVHARAGIIINTGEDNHLTTADAVDEAHTVTVSQLLNERLAHEAGLADWQLGLGHAFEIDPERPGSFRLELAHALLARGLFPDAPLKWMPPTRHMTGDVFRGYLLDAAGGLHEDFAPQPGGFIDRRAHTVLTEAVKLLERIADHPQGLIQAIADGTFGITKRRPDGVRCSSWAGRASTRRWPPSSAWTRCSAGGRPPARSPATWCPRSSRGEGPHDRARPATRHDRHPPPLRALRARPLRRGAGRRRLHAGPVR
jgi:beta-lysine 5,6-aminomutase alpha subunit